ncbi:SAM-dependent DNA methyltransferase [Cryobacterium sp. MDB2-10]|uniref:SAM-dependent DNA methyltransferase n=1 Tax=Cryobacterium glucosi TaxID=1259175 RepID=A0ABY2IR18_9MICO|nr:SAM-dependent DNA methyltransferase [Cryobacterium sp. MDB2-A-1]TFC09747.1 SAM-dependent DNA methyltransferase [Cryobacterium sp. MDB2-A-2]TFC22799.1 SAM-dependent DNA methyltransferase [Cryobacterium glucosi]TFC23978.1 SAM-dependent DNA methyltransferase [Cryobacterium sp. MDB2-10]
MTPPEKLVKSRRRVAEHGEVFTPAWLVQEMLDLVKSETERIDSRFLEPACGSGNFLIPILERKLAVVQTRYGSSEFERRHYALLALMCVYGIELLPDNAAECRSRLLSTFATFLNLERADAWWRCAERVLALNIIEGNALTVTASDGEHITFPQWSYLGRGKFQRRDFRYDALSQQSSTQGTLMEDFIDHEVFVPVATFAPMTVQKLAA